MSEDQNKEVQHLLTLLKIYRQRLLIHQKQQAIHGLANAPASILYEIHECSEKISQINKQLEDKGIATNEINFAEEGSSFDLANETIQLIPFVNAVEKAFDRYVSDCSKYFEELNQIIIRDELNSSLIPQSFFSDRKMVFSKILKLVEELPERIEKSTEHIRIGFTSELSVAIKKHKLKILDIDQDNYLKKLIIPSISESLPSEEDPQWWKEYIGLLGMGIGSVGGFLGSAAGLFVTGSILDKFEGRRIRKEAVILFPRIFSQSLNELKSKKYEIIDLLIKWCK